MNIENANLSQVAKSDNLFFFRATPNMFKKLKEIITGWHYVFFRRQEIELLAAERAEICTPCPHNTGTKCGLCGCPLKAKMRSPDSSCPDGRWQR